MSTSVSNDPSADSHYELLPTDSSNAEGNLPRITMGPDQQLKTEGRPFDRISRQIALVCDLLQILQDLLSLCHS